MAGKITLGVGNDTFKFKLGTGTTAILDFGATYYSAKLNGASVEPAVTTAATGSGTVAISRDGDTALVHLQVKDLSSNATAANVNLGPKGQGSTSIFELNPPSATAFSVDGTWTQGVASYLDWIRTDGLHFRVQTANFPSGEIRGQITGPVKGKDVVDLTAVNIGDARSVFELLSDVAGEAKLTVVKNGVATSLKFTGLPVSELLGSDFKFQTSTAKQTITGTSKVDYLFGAGGNDNLRGGGGNDKLFGEAGNDKLWGGAGRDMLYGGRGGSDIFDYNSVTETGKTSSTRDIIKDFDRFDRIDLSGIDANGSASGNGAFTLLAGGKAFGGHRGELRWTVDTKSGFQNTKTIVSGDIDGDKKADFQIELAGRHKLDAGDFIL